MIVYDFSLKFTSTPNNSIELLIQGSRPFPTPGSPWTSERTSMFEVDIETFERCNARPERNKAKESGPWWTVDQLRFFLNGYPSILFGCNWFDLLAMDCPNKNSRVFSNEFSWLHCTYQFDGQLKTLSGTLDSVTWWNNITDSLRRILLSQACFFHTCVPCLL